MSAHDPSAYGRDVADAYDALYRAAFDSDGAVTLNTLSALPDQESQVGCVLNASQHLRPGGTFVVEGFVLDAEKLHRDEGMRPRYLDEHRIELQFMRHDRATQRLHNILVSLGPDGVLVRPVNHRYIWPSELDLMARLAGLRLAERWGGWRGEPYTSASPLHVSVYRA